MNAIRRDEDTDNIHSIYVDQWDWEKIIYKEERNVETLKNVVKNVYKALKATETYMSLQYDYIEEILPKDIFFITTQELEDMYPDCTPEGTGIQNHQVKRCRIYHADRRQAGIWRKA